jgi:NADH:ubiquinone oxidoreductase subunit 3 (subunit A)
MIIIIVILFVSVLTGILLAVNALLAPQRPNAQKLSTYECGYDTLRGQTRSPFTISFYIVSVLFLAFDVEVALLYPLAPLIGVVGQYTY